MRTTPDNNKKTMTETKEFNLAVYISVHHSEASVLRGPFFFHGNI